MNSNDRIVYRIECCLVYALVWICWCRYINVIISADGCTGHKLLTSLFEGGQKAAWLLARG